MSQQLTDVESAFYQLLNNLSELDDSERPSMSNLWEVCVRFKSMSSSTLAQILSVLMAKTPLHFQTSLPTVPTRAIVFTDHVNKDDKYNTRILLYSGNDNSYIEDVFGSDIESVEIETNQAKKYTIVWTNPKDIKSASEQTLHPNIFSQLTRPDIFPTTSSEGINIPLWKISFTSEAQYSASPLRANEAMMTDVFGYFKDTPSNQYILMLDGTANCGSDAIGSIYHSAKSKHMLRITAIELNKLNYEALTANVNIYGYSDLINTIHADTVKWIENDDGKTAFNCVYFDPPWGGKDYKTEEKIRLMLGERNIWDICQDLVSDKRRRKNLRLIVVKGPFNLDREDQSLLKFGNAVMFKNYPVAKNIVYVYIDCVSLFSKVK